jgi:hypothetical protein
MLPYSTSCVNSFVFSWYTKKMRQKYNRSRLGSPGVGIIAEVAHILRVSTHATRDKDRRRWCAWPISSADVSELNKRWLFGHCMLG